MRRFTATALRFAALAGAAAALNPISAFAQAAGSTESATPGMTTSEIVEPAFRGPIDGAFGFQEYATDIMREVVWFNNYTLWFLVPIGIFVGGLLGYVIWKFNAKNNPVASRTSHNTTIEVVWTVAPVLILLFLAVPSFQLLSAQFDPPGEPELTVKTTGYRWYWDYQYQNDEDGSPVVEFSSIPLLEDTDREAAGKSDRVLYPDLLVVDNEFVVPEDTVVRLLVTAGDVIHSWAMPSFGKKMDAIPGRLNETWFKVDEPGIYYGQCSELCGANHAFMPIAVRVVPKEDFAAWLELAAGGDLNGANASLLAAIEDRRAPKLAAADAVAPAVPDAQ